MPRFRVRLEDGAGNFRLTSLTADDEKAARAACERMEHQRSAYQLSPEVRDEMQDEEKAETRTSAQTRWALSIDKQTDPYGVVDVKELG